MSLFSKYFIFKKNILIAPCDMYVLTNRLTQDCLENLFSYLMAMEAANNQPSAFNLKYGLRWYKL